MKERSIFENLKKRITESLNTIEEELTRLGLRADKVLDGKARLEQRVISQWARDILFLHYWIQQEIRVRANAVPGDNPKVAIPPEGMDLNGYLAKLERAFFENAIEMKQGNRAAAARLLGIDPHTFRKRAKNFGLAKSLVLR